MIGGTYPFWAEGLNATRGPMSVPPQMIHGRTVQAAAFRNDAKRTGIDGIVHIKVEVGHDGKVKKMKLLSGDSEFVEDAKKYLQGFADDVGFGGIDELGIFCELRSDVLLNADLQRFILRWSRW